MDNSESRKFVADGLRQMKTDELERIHSHQGKFLLDGFIYNDSTRLG